MPAQKRGAFMSHLYAAEARPLRRGRRSRGRKKCRCSTNAGRRSPADRRQRSGIRAEKRAGPGGEVVNQSNCRQTRPTPSSSKPRRAFQLSASGGLAGTSSNSSTAPASPTQRLKPSRCPPPHTAHAAASLTHLRPAAGPQPAPRAASTHISLSPSASHSRVAGPHQPKAIAYSRPAPLPGNNLPSLSP
jgi:hypothetical protein